MSAAAEEQRAALRDACGSMAGICAKFVRERVGREVKVVVIVGDLADGNVYTGIWELDRDGMIAALRSVLDATEARNCATRVSVGGKVVAEFERPS